jgi:hypothetical protein
MLSVARLGTRSLLLGILAASLLNLPATAASETPLGMVVMADRALVSSENAMQGATVYSGDALMTRENGSLRLAVGPAQVYLLGSSTATLLENEAHVIRAKVHRGTINFSTPQPGQLEVGTPLGVIRGASGDRIFGQVSVLSSSKIEISAYQGTLLMTTANGEAKTIAAGETYEADASPGPQGVSGVGQPQPIKWKRIRLTAIIVGGAAVASYFIWQEATESCSKPNCQE